MKNSGRSTAERNTPYRSPNRERSSGTAGTRLFFREINPGYTGSDDPIRYRACQFTELMTSAEKRIIRVIHRERHAAGKFPETVVILAPVLYNMVYEQ